MFGKDKRKKESKRIKKTETKCKREQQPSDSAIRNEHDVEEQSDI